MTELKETTLSYLRQILSGYGNSFIVTTRLDLFNTLSSKPIYLRFGHGQCYHLFAIMIHFLDDPIEYKVIL